MNSLSKESSQNWIDDKYDNSGKTKNAPPGSRTQTGITLITKTETTTENQKCLKELSKSL